MGRLLRGKEQFEMIDIKNKENDIQALFEKSYNFSSNFVLFPVRHHSPVCSYHLLKTIEEYKPDAILIEGPNNSNDLIDFIVSKETKAPFCIYLSYDDKKGELSEDKGKYRAFYPFLDFSPELVALREGRKQNIHCEFIDLNYGEKLLNSVKEEVKEDYEYDREFLQSKYYEMLVDKLGCKNFNELWELLFEIEGYHSDTKSFVRNLFFYCYYTRENTNYDELINQGDIMREYYMAENIINAMNKYKKILVVTGGIHTIALVDLITSEDFKKMKIKKIKKENSPSYLMPYSFEESDRNLGYQSGMVFPFFYQNVWENINKRKKTPFENSVLKFIIVTANTIRKKQPLSIADEMQSFYMAKGLSQLRSKKECGAFELIDSVKSSFVKGEINSYYQVALKNLYKLMTGMNMGQVDKNSGVPPIVNDFLEKCKKYKIQTNTSLLKETKLDIYNNEAHREKSRFFHKMDFLKTGFCKYLKGQDTNSSSGRILLRESWEYRFNPSVQVELISNSAYGGTLEDACVTIISKDISENHNNSREISKKLVKANYMGLNEIYEQLSEKLIDIIGTDMDFLSVSDCFNNICTIKSYSESIEGNTIPYIENIIELNINRIFTLIYTILYTKKDDEDKICKAIKFLYNYFIDNGTEYEKSQFLQAMISIYNDIGANGALSGISCGVLLKRDKIDVDDVILKFNSYLNGSDNSKKMSAAFLKGFFNIAKDIIFIDDRLLTSLDSILKDSQGDLFLEILPDLRLTFTYFLPFEIDKIAKKVSSFYNVSQSSVLYGDVFEQKEIELASDIDKYCSLKIDEWIP